MSKPRYLLDLGDILNPGLFSLSNSNNLISGLNVNAASIAQQLAVGVGGSGNKTYTDQQLLIYSASAKAFLSSGYTPTTLPIPFTKGYVTPSPISFLANLGVAGTGGQVALNAHGLGAVPKLVRWVFVFTTGGTGSGAAATATLTGGAVTAVTLVPGQGGSGYTSPPTVVLVPGTTGTPATITANLTSMAVSSFTISGGGTGYSSPQTVYLVGGGGSGALATATLSPIGIGSIAVSPGGSGYLSAPGVIISGGTGSGAMAHATVVSGAVTVVTVDAAGFGYTWGSPPTIAFGAQDGGWPMNFELDVNSFAIASGNNQCAFAYGADATNMILSLHVADDSNAPIVAALNNTILTSDNGFNPSPANWSIKGYAFA